MMLTADEIPALPLWVNGHAFLTMVQDFYQVQDAGSGKTLRRVPLCGEDEVLEVVEASTRALADWQTSTAEARHQPLAAMAATLDQPRYREHFVKLLQQETGKEASAAEAEISAAQAALQNPAAVAAKGVLALVCDDAQPLAAYARLIAETVSAGAVAVLKPSPRAPSCGFALAELWIRAGGAPGIINVVQGDEAALKALAAHPAVAAFRCAGRAAWLDKLRPLVADKASATLILE